MNENAQSQKGTSGKATVTLPAVVEKVIPSVDPSKPDKAQIVVEAADDLYREIRVENTLQDGNGNPVSLKKGAEVEVTIEADSTATTPQSTLATAKETTHSSDERKPQN